MAVILPPKSNIDTDIPLSFVSVYSHHLPKTVCLSICIVLSPYLFNVPIKLSKASRSLNTPASARTRANFFPSSFCKRSEEHTSELQSRGHLVCRLLL